jgi:transposase
MARDSLPPMTTTSTAFEIESLRTLLLAERTKVERLEAERSARHDVVAQRDRTIEQLRQIIRELRRHRFGRRSERLDADQLALALEDLEQQLGEAEAAQDAAASGETASSQAGPRRRARQPRAINRGALPAHLPREEVRIDVADKSCPCCGGALHCIGEERGERLDVVPARLRVLVTVRPKYACRACEESIVQAPAPARLIPGGLPTDALVARVAVAKYADHLPLYRQAQIFGRQDIALDRSTLADWMGIAAFALRPVQERMLALLKGSARIFADETTAPVLDPGRGRTKTGKFWAYARDDRPWAGGDPPGVVYVYAPDRKAIRPAAHLAGFAGILQVDGYAAYQAALAGTVTFALCWAHVRRNFYELHDPKAGTSSPIAGAALRRIAELYLVEREIGGLPAAQRQAIRQQRSRPIVAALKPWLADNLARVSAGSPLAKALRYALKRWDGLVAFLDDGRIELDNNAVERAMRPIALGRKNHLFAGSDGGAEHWAILVSLIETCKLNAIDPEAYLNWVFGKLAVKRRMADVDELLPWVYAVQLRSASVDCTASAAA